MNRYSAQGQASSDTLSGISGYSAPGSHSEVRTGDASTAIGPIFDKDAVKADIAAQVEITAAFGQMAPKAWADYAQTQVKAARASGDSDAAQAWGEGGAYRIIGHTVLGAASGGSSGASGALASAYVMPKVGQILDKAELHPMASQGLGMLASFGIGYAAGAAGCGARLAKRMPRHGRAPVSDPTKTSSFLVGVTHMQTLNRRVSALEAANPPAEELTIIRRIVWPEHLNAGIHRLRGDGGELWERLSGETEQGFIDRASLEVKRNHRGTVRLVSEETC